MGSCSDSSEVADAANQQPAPLDEPDDGHQEDYGRSTIETSELAPGRWPADLVDYQKECDTDP